MHALGLEFGSAAQLSKRPGSVWNCLWGNALKRSPGIIRKSRVSYPGPGFLSSATWPSLPKKHYNGLNQTNLYSYPPSILHLFYCTIYEKNVLIYKLLTSPNMWHLIIQAMFYDTVLTYIFILEVSLVLLLFRLQI